MHRFRATSSKVWASDFRALRFRHASSHAECTECVKHKSIIQGLSHHLLARRTQQELFYRHLEHQFQDRAIYWRSRSDSRTKPGCLTIIADGMDQSKCALPRAAALRAKCFDGLQRLRLHLSAALGHGKFIALYLTEANMPKDANYCIETVCNALTLASKSMDLASTDVTLQCDNTSRELKNGPVLRLCASLVSNKTVKTMMVSCLRTGHSHEDIDQCFGVIASKIAKLRHVPTSLHFLQYLQQICNELDRPHEAGRHVLKVDQCRDWRPWLLQGVPTQLVGIGGPGAPHLFHFCRFDSAGASISTNRFVGARGFQ